MPWKCPLLALALLGLLGCAAYVEGPGPPPWERSPRAEVSFFYDALAPHGDWLWVEPWGWAWTPRDVEPGWRPYTDGRWAWTDLGWTWVSDRAWGWAPFHYGRWTYDAYYGWIWIPDRVWAPAWVAWRSGPGWIGWAPLPPGAHWRIGIGLDLGNLDLGVAIVEHGWCFVPDRDFLAPRIHRHLAPLPRHGHLLRETRDRTRYEEVGHRVAVRAFDPEEIEPRAGRVERYRIEDLERPSRGGEAVERGAVGVYRPEVKPELKPEVKEEAPGRAPERHAQPVPPPSSARDQRELERTKARDERDLKAWEAEQRKRLDQEQSRERRQPPEGESAAEVRQRQEKERRTLSDEAKRERQLQDNRRDRKAKEKASAAGQKPARRKPPEEKEKDDGGG